MLIVLLCGSLLTLAPAVAERRDHDQHEQHHAALNARGAKFMGFDQAATTHHFILTKEGGRIEVKANDAKDTASINQIREHLQHIAAVFAKGDFSLPGLVHDTKAVPGVAAMKSHAAALSFAFEEIGRGAQVRIVGTSREAITAVHEFLRFQITDHKTGDPLTPRDRD
jgi:hypothetical protein